MMNLRVVVLTSLLGGFGCDTTEPPPPSPPGPPQPGPTISLQAEDAGVTEAWLKLSIPDTITGRSFTLVRDSQVILTSSIMASDTVLIDEGLTPNHTYLYRAFRVEDTTVVDTSDVVTLTTMDTTSHSFTFDIDTLGSGNSSVLLDVAIIDENNIWAVGEMSLLDSMGQYETFNLAKWDGSVWNLQAVEFPVCDINGNEIGTAVHMTYAVMAFAPTDIWMTDGGNIVHWNGITFVRLCLPPGLIDGAVLNLWGSSNSDFYAVGRQGTVIHYGGGGSWQKLETGTELDVNDVFGAMSASGELEVYAVAAKEFVTLERKILHIVGTTVTTLSDSGIPGSLQGVWFKPERRYYVAGNGLFWKHMISATGPWVNDNATQYYLYGLTGVDLNDIVASGTFGEVVHYNGSSWTSYRSVTGLSLGLYYRVAMKDNLVVAVGFDGARGIVARGIR